MPERRPTLPRGFSLIELLVAVSMVALLLSVLLPTLSQVRESGRDAVCRSQLRQAHHAQSLYEQDAGRFAAFWSDAEPVSWRVRLTSYTLEGGSGVHEVFVCPSVDEQMLVGVPVVAGMGHSASTLAVNGAMQFPQWGFQSSSVPVADRIILLGDQPVELMETMLTSDNFGVWANELGSGWYAADNHDAALGYRHSSHASAPMAFVDGHVARLDDLALRRASGHWYWWDALVNDTAAPSPTGLPANVSMPLTITPSPSPVTAGGGPLPPGQSPTGPLTLPCGCPVPASP